MAFVRKLLEVVVNCSPLEQFRGFGELCGNDVDVGEMEKNTV